MANERTFLAWIRTGIGIMAFGFVIENFSVPYDYNDTTGIQGLPDGYNFIAFLGILLVFLGAGAGLLATY
jgi:putative membrane protein